MELVERNNKRIQELETLIDEDKKWQESENQK